MARRLYHNLELNAGERKVMEGTAISFAATNTWRQREEHKQAGLPRGAVRPRPGGPRCQAVVIPVWEHVARHCSCPGIAASRPLFRPSPLMQRRMGWPVGRGLKFDIAVVKHLALVRSAVLTDFFRQNHGDGA